MADLLVDSFLLVPRRNDIAVRSSEAALLTKKPDDVNVLFFTNLSDANEENGDTVLSVFAPVLTCSPRSERERCGVVSGE